MDNRELNKDQLIKYWIDGAEDDFETMTAMFDSKRYSWSLFIGHLMIEKLLKAYFVKLYATHAPYTHNVIFLAEKCKLEVNAKRLNFLEKINEFNLECRYPGEKYELKKKTNKRMVVSNLKNVEEFRNWILTQLK